MKTIFQKMLEEAGFTVRSYSGRSMYGKECLGVECAGLSHLIGGVFEYLSERMADSNSEETYDDLQELLMDCAVAFGKVRTDNLGMDTIAYFPEVSFSEEDDEEEEEEEEEKYTVTVVHETEAMKVEQIHMKDDSSLTVKGLDSLGKVR